MILVSMLCGCSDDNGKGSIIVENTSSETTIDETSTEVATITETEIDTTLSTDYSNYHYLTLDDILGLPFYLPELTVDSAKEQGYEYINRFGADVFINGSVEYIFYSYEPGPVYISVVSNEDSYKIMGIGVGDTFDESLNKLPNDYDWKDSFDNLIYGRMPNKTEQENPYHGNAYIDTNGNGTITLVPSENYPFVQFIFSDFKVIKVNILCYEH